MDVDLDGIFLHNSTFDYDTDYEYKEELDPKSKKSVWILTAYSFVLIVGLLGNVLLMAVLAQKRQSWRASDTLFLHLGVADILLLATLPFRAAQADGSGSCSVILCKICGAVFNMNFFCGIFLLVCITLDHYLSTVRAIQVCSRRKPRSVCMAGLLVWLVSLLLTIPDWIFLEVREDKLKKAACVHVYSGSSQKVSRLFHHAVGFTLPAAVLIFCCASILLRLQCSCKALQKQRATVVILPLVGVFCLCWVPYNFALIVDTVTGSSWESREESLETALLATSVLGCVHACVRPLLYLGLCRNFRRRSAALLRCITDEPRSSLWELGVEEEALPEQSHAGDELKQMASVTEHQSEQC